MVAGSSVLAAAAVVSIEVQGSDDCEMYTEQIAEIMVGVVEKFSPRGCEDLMLESYLVADVRMPIAGSESAWIESDSLFGLITAPVADDIAAVTVILEKYEVLERRMKEEFHQRIDLLGSKIALVLNNDERTPAKLSVAGAFLDNEPVLEETAYEHSRREKAEIRRPSDVATFHLARYGFAGGLVLEGITR